MRAFLLILFSVTITFSFAQFDKPVTVSTSANFNIGLSGLGADNSGVGLNTEASFHIKHRLHAIIETGFNHFFGDKVLYIDTLTGKNATTNIYSIKAGPQFYINKNLAISATAGPTWYKVRKFDYSKGAAFKYSITGFFTKKKKVVVKVFVVDIPANFKNILFLGLAIGIRF